MSRWPVLAAAAIVALGLPSAGAGERDAGGAFVLTALADQGTVYWRPCSPRGWSLGFRIWPITTTTALTFRAGSLTVHRTLQPGDPTAWFPFRRDRVQRLFVVSGGEAETIYSRVRVDFDEPGSLHSCWIYAPPQVGVTVVGKDHIR